MKLIPLRLVKINFCLGKYVLISLPCSKWNIFLLPVCRYQIGSCARFEICDTQLSLWTSLHVVLIVEGENEWCRQLIHHYTRQIEWYLTAKHSSAEKFVTSGRCLTAHNPWSPAYSTCLECSRMQVEHSCFVVAVYLGLEVLKYINVPLEYWWSVMGI